eukprot:g33201.t1
MADDPATREEPEEEVQDQPEDPEVKELSDALEVLWVGRIRADNIPNELGGNRAIVVARSPNANSKQPVEGKLQYWTH